MKKLVFVMALAWQAATPLQASVKMLQAARARFRTGSDPAHRVCEAVNFPFLSAALGAVLIQWRIRHS